MLHFKHGGHVLADNAARAEDPLGHALFYGNLLALAAGGRGRWLPAAAPAGAAA